MDTAPGATAAISKAPQPKNWWRNTKAVVQLLRRCRCWISWILEKFSFSSLVMKWTADQEQLLLSLYFEVKTRHQKKMTRDVQRYKWIVDKLKEEDVVVAWKQVKDKIGRLKKTGSKKVKLHVQPRVRRSRLERTGAAADDDDDEDELDWEEILKEAKWPLLKYFYDLWKSHPILGLAISTDSAQDTSEDDDDDDNNADDAEQAASAEAANPSATSNRASTSSDSSTAHTTGNSGTFGDGDIDDDLDHDVADDSEADSSDGLPPARAAALSAQPVLPSAALPAAALSAQPIVPSAALPAAASTPLPLPTQATARPRAQAQAQTRQEPHNGRARPALPPTPPSRVGRSRTAAPEQQRQQQDQFLASFGNIMEAHTQQTITLQVSNCFQNCLFQNRFWKYGLK